MLKHALRALAIVASALTLTACGADWVPKWADAFGKASTATVPVTKAQAQQALADAQKVHAGIVRIQIAYLDQKPCGTAGALQPPLCASLAVSREWSRLDRKFSEVMARAQAEVATLGDNPKVIDAALAAVRLALGELQTFQETNARGVKA